LYTRAKFAPSDPRKDKVKELIKEITVSLKRDWEALEWVRPDIRRAFKRFLYKYQEGALIILSLIHGRFVEIEGCDPVDIWECIATLSDVMQKRFNDTNFINNTFASYFRMSAYFSRNQDYSYEEFVKRLDDLDFIGPRDWVYFNYQSDCGVPDAVIQRRWEWFSTHYTEAAMCWKGLSEPKRIYLMCRAFSSDSYYLRRFGGRLPASTNVEYERVVEALRTLIRNDRQWREQEEERAAQAEEMKEAQENCRWKAAEIVVPPRPYLEPRVLSAAQLRAVKRACAKELAAAGETKAVAATIVDFAVFCERLAKPENHIRIKGQYVEKQVRVRTEIDMVNEAARLLSSVEPHSAYVRFERKEGRTGAWTGKVRMEKLGAVGADALARAHDAIKPAIERYTRPRERIRREIEERQNAWRASAMSGLARGPLPAGKRLPVPAVPSGSKLTEPPPTRTTSRLPRDR
jgi:hypothetical protein